MAFQGGAGQGYPSNGNIQVARVASSAAQNLPQAQQYDGEQVNNNEEAFNKMVNSGFNYAKDRAAMYRKEDAELWELLTSVPRLTGVSPYICLFLNIFLPGTGTMLCSCLGYQQAWSKTQLSIGII